MKTFLGVVWNPSAPHSLWAPFLPPLPALYSVVASQTFLLVVFCFWLCHAAYRILVPRPGIKPGPRQWKHGVLTTGQPKNSPYELFFFSRAQVFFPASEPLHRLFLLPRSLFPPAFYAGFFSYLSSNDTLDNYPFPPPVPTLWTYPICVISIPCYYLLSCHHSGIILFTWLKFPEAGALSVLLMIVSRGWEPWSRAETWLGILND